MFNTSVASSIITIVRALHKPENTYGQPLRGLLFELDLRVYQYPENEEDDEVRETRDVFIVVAGNRSVWIHVKESPFYLSPFSIPCEAWVNTGNHDSCWTEGIERPLSTLYFEMCEQVNPLVAPVSLSQFTTFKWYDISLTWKKDPADKYGYRRILTSLRSV